MESLMKLEPTPQGSGTLPVRSHAPVITSVSSSRKWVENYRSEDGGECKCQSGISRTNLACSGCKWAIPIRCSGWVKFSSGICQAQLPQNPTGLILLCRQGKSGSVAHLGWPPWICLWHQSAVLKSSRQLSLAQARHWGNCIQPHIPGNILCLWHIRSNTSQVSAVAQVKNEEARISPSCVSANSQGGLEQKCLCSPLSLGNVSCTRYQVVVRDSLAAATAALCHLRISPCRGILRQPDMLTFQLLCKIAVLKRSHSGVWDLAHYDMQGGSVPQSCIRSLVRE